MRVLTFKGGVHPPEEKHHTECKAIEDIPVPDRVFIPLSQHTGAPARVLVKKGDRVKKGQMIGEAAGFISAPVHASISGTVVSVADYPHPFGKPQPAVEIESDGKSYRPEGSEGSGGEEADTSLSPISDWENADPKDFKQRISGSGIVGMGGATFPTHVKLSPPEGKTIDALILNGAECEPYITADHRLMLEAPEKVVTGLRIIMRILGLSKAIIAIENNKPDAIAKIREVAREFPGIRVVAMKVKYPQGSEKQLIKAVLNRDVPAGGLPMDVGSLVQNVGTAVAIFDAVTLSTPLIERVVTVTGPAIKDPKNLRARIGTPVSRLLEFCGGINGDAGKVILGGPMMGLCQSTLDVPVIKGTNGVLVLRRRDVKILEPGPCIRCGSCVRACPMFLLPNIIGLFVRTDRIEDAEAYRVMDCMECGSCAYVCPSNIPLVHLFRYAKSEIMAKRKKEQGKR
jgi:electron transport complex protein RnfC